MQGRLFALKKRQTVRTAPSLHGKSNLGKNSDLLIFLTYSVLGTVKGCYQKTRPPISVLWKVKLSQENKKT